MRSRASASALGVLDLGPRRKRAEEFRLALHVSVETCEVMAADPSHLGLGFPRLGAAEAHTQIALAEHPAGVPAARTDLPRRRMHVAWVQGA